MKLTGSRFSRVWLLLGLVLSFPSQASHPLSCEQAIGREASPFPSTLSAKRRLLALDQVPQPTPLGFQQAKLFPASGNFLELSVGKVLNSTYLDLTLNNPNLSVTLTDADPALKESFATLIKAELVNAQRLQGSKSSGPYLESLRSALNNWLDRLPLSEQKSTVEKFLQASADSIAVDQALPPRFSLLQVDNDRPLPFPNENFDAILMSRGLCNCHRERGTLCAGIPISVDGLSRFLLEVARVLNRSNPQALAVLGGAIFIKPAKPDVVDISPALIESAIQIVERAYPDLEFRYLDSGIGEFAGLAMSPRNSQSPARH